MKTSLFFQTVVFATIASLTGCGSSSSSSDTPISSSSDTPINSSSDTPISSSSDTPIDTDTTSPLQPYFGSWKYAHDGTELYITSDTAFNENTVLTEIDDNQLQIDNNGYAHYLIRNGIKHVNVTGTVNNLINASAGQLSRNTLSAKTSSSGISGIGGINVILTNIKDENINTSANTDSNGDFDVSDLPAGTYDVSVDNGAEGIDTQITLTDSSEDVGNLFLAGENTNNFTTELMMNDEFIYADGNTYTGVVRVHNVSQVDGIGLSYNISLSDSSLKSFSFDNVLGSIPAQGHKDIPIRMSFNSFLLNERKITVNTVIKDINYNEWNDNLHFQADRKKLRVNFSSEQSNVRGYISLPNRKQKNINLSNGYIEVPYTIDNDYVIALANPDLSNETAYSIGFEAATADISYFNDTGKYESQNSSESGAIVVNKGGNISSYLHVGDIDFYRLKMDETAALFTNVGYALRNTIYTSNPVAITADILIHGDIAEIDNGTLFINGIEIGSSTNIQLDDVLTVQLTSSSEFSSASRSTLNIGSIKSTYSVSTEDLDTTIASFTFTPVENAFPETEYLSNPISITGINAAVNASTSMGTLIKNDVALGVSSTTVQEGDTLRIKALSPASFNSTNSAVLTIGDKTQEFNISTRSKYFENIDFADLNAIYYSNDLIVPNNNTSISISHGVLIKNNIELLDLVTTANIGDVIKIKLSSSTIVNTSVSTNVMVGNLNELFKITTKPKDYAQLTNGTVTPSNDTATFYYLSMPSDGYLDINGGYKTYLTFYTEDMQVVNARSYSNRTIQLSSGTYIVKVEAYASYLSPFTLTY
jgi:hypothetical protein